MSLLRSRLFDLVLLGTVIAAQDAPKDIPRNVTYVCNGERLYVESCNIRDLSDTSTCLVAYPDRPQHNGFTAHTNETRGALKKLLPTCQQPSAKEIANEQAFQKKQQEILEANTRKANPQANAPQAPGPPQAARVPAAQSKSPEEREMNRCITSGRVPAKCLGGALLNPFNAIVAQVLPKLGKPLDPGPEISGAFEGAGNWRIEFEDRGAAVKCSILASSPYDYKLEFKNNRAAVIIQATPQPIALTLNADGTLTGPGPIQVDGVVITGYSTGGNSGYTDKNGVRITDGQAAMNQQSGQPVYFNGTRYTGLINSQQPTYAPKRATCAAQHLSSKNAGPTAVGLATNVLTSMFNDGDSGPPTPPGIRMHGIFAASTGFSVQFMPESAVLGCGPDAGRAYPPTRSSRMEPRPR